MSNEKTIMNGATCKGSVALGSGCMRCQKCLSEISRGVELPGLVTLSSASVGNTLVSSPGNPIDPTAPLKRVFYNPDTHVVVQKPEWKTFEQELPEVGSIIYRHFQDTPETSVNVFIKLTYNPYPVKDFGSEYIQITPDSAISPSQHWTYAKSEQHPEGLDLTMLLPK